MKEQLRRTKKSSSRRPGRRRGLLFLLVACLVVCYTTYALMVPAMAQEGEYTCGKEAHSHGISCYQWEEGSDPQLVCEKEEHQHDEHCLTADPHPERYICGHAYEHTHEDGCFRDGELICTLVQHTHTEDCLAEEYRLASSEDSAQPSPSATPSDGDLADGKEPVGEDTISSDDGSPVDGEGSVEDDPSISSDGGSPVDGEGSVEDDPSIPDGTSAEPKRSRSLRAEQSTAPDRSDPYCVDMSTLSGLEFSFTVRNKYNTPITDLSLTAGDGYTFSVNVNIPSGLWPDPYIYYYHLDTGECKLFMGNHVAIEEHTQGWANIGSAELWVVAESGGYGLFFRCSDPDWSVYESSFNGELSGAHTASEVDLNVGKDAAWNSTDLTYFNTITAWIPRMYDNYSHYYFLQDTTTVLNPQNESEIIAQYDGFLSNYQNGSFLVSIDETPIRSIDQIGETDSDIYAYYLDSDGKLYLLNKTSHNGEHEVALHADLKDGWCLCWQDTLKRKLTVSYEDTAGADYVDGRTYTNTVHLSQPSIADNHTETANSTARQKHSSTDDFNSSARNYTVTVLKQYEGNNPDSGAVFGLYEADTDTLVARSVTESDGSGLVRNVYAVVPAMPNAIYSAPYTPGADEDRITFIHRYLSLNKVYYIKEIETVDGFQLSDQRYYFFVTSPTPAPLPAGYENISVDILNNWQRMRSSYYTLSHEFATPLVNEKLRYTLPETGSSLGLILQVTGIVLLLSPTALFFRYRQRKH